MFSFSTLALKGISCEIFCVFNFHHLEFIVDEYFQLKEKCAHKKQAYCAIQLLRIRRGVLLRKLDKHMKIRCANNKREIKYDYNKRKKIISKL